MKTCHGAQVGSQRLALPILQLLNQVLHTLRDKLCGSRLALELLLLLTNIVFFLGCPVGWFCFSQRMRTKPGRLGAKEDGAQ